MINIAANQISAARISSKINLAICDASFKIVRDIKQTAEHFIVMDWTTFKFHLLSSFLCPIVLDQKIS